MIKFYEIRWSDFRKKYADNMMTSGLTDGLTQIIVNVNKMSTTVLLININ